MISSAMPSAKYSLSASLLMFENGSTATDFAEEIVGCGIVAVSVGVVRLPDASACANCAAVLYRCPMSVAIALVTARSTGSGMLLRSERGGAAVSVNRFAMTACGVG